MKATKLVVKGAVLASLAAVTTRSATFIASSVSRLAMNDDEPTSLSSFIPSHDAFLASSDAFCAIRVGHCVRHESWYAVSSMFAACAVGTSGS